MARAALLAALITLAPTLPEGCAKLLGKGRAAQPDASAEPEAKAVPATSATAATATATAMATATATAPPVWAPPETAEPAPAPAPAAIADSDLAKARALSEAGDHKKVRALLEKKVKAGKANHDEASVLMESCSILRDKACVQAIKAKHPGVEAP